MEGTATAIVVCDIMCRPTCVKDAGSLTAQVRDGAGHIFLLVSFILFIFSIHLVSIFLLFIYVVLL